MKRSVFLVVVLALFLGEPARGADAPIDDSVAPPAGNSLHTTVNTVSAYKVFTCYDSVWSTSKVYAGLVDPKSNNKLGNYTAAPNSTGEVGTWTLFNSAGDQAESGHSWSSITGIPVGNSTATPTTLFQAASHQNSGAAAAVSYVQLSNVVGGQTPPPEKCTSSSGNYAVTVPFSGQYLVWTQDPVPASVPGQLAAPGRVVEGFFAVGTVCYSPTGSDWTVTSKEGTLYNLPGSPAIGTFWMKDGSEGWQISDPNGFSLQGSQISTADPNDACAWSLSKVSSESSPRSVLAPISHIQMISTRGGQKPAPGLAKIPGTAFNVPFTAIFWLYTAE